MRELSESIEIPATPEQVWAVLTDLDAYPRWNPFIVEASGVLEVGQKLRVRIKPPGRRASRFSPTVTAIEEAVALEWHGSLGIKGIFDGTHRFELSPSEFLPDGTTFIQREAFSGVLVRPLERMLRDTLAGFELMNRALLARVTKT
ncbi:MAG: SRPBCC family protein [Acidimicrobiales bacterium]